MRLVTAFLQYRKSMIEVTKKRHNEVPHPIEFAEAVSEYLTAKDMLFAERKKVSKGKYDMERLDYLRTQWERKDTRLRNMVKVIRENPRLFLENAEETGYRAVTDNSRGWELN